MKDKFAIDEWFTLLEPDVRRMAITNWKTQGYASDPAYRCGSLVTALGSAFIWNETPERADFWVDLQNKANHETRKPATSRGMIDCTIGE